jgi:immune inhibitor A
MLRRLIILVGVLATLSHVLAAPGAAAPLRPDLLDPDRPGMTLRGTPILSKPAWIDAPPPVRAGGVRGTNHILIICIQFPDLAATQTVASFGNMVFGPWSPASMNDYYQEVSYGNVSLAGSAVGWYTAAHPRSYYGNSQHGFGSYPNNAGSLVAEAMAAAELGGVDFSQYDNDGDGTAESIFICHAGEGFETSTDQNDIQSHYCTMSGMGDPSAPYFYDGKWVDPYACDAELEASSPANHVEIGVWCHEYGHVLGLPDLYDVGRQCTGIVSHGIGVYGVMSYGCWGANVTTPSRPVHMCAWSKIQLGWITPTVISAPVTGQSLPRVETSGTVLKIGMDTRPTEHFLLSYRDNTYGFDLGLPGTGLCIWHIDDEITSDNDCEQGGSCTSSSHYMVALEQPDGNFNLDCGTAGNYGDAGDVYPYGGNNSFTASSTPSSNRYVGASSGTSITNIAVGGGAVTMDITPGELYQYLVYDDGSCELGLSWGTPGWGFAQRITPSSYPFQLEGIYVFSQDVYSPNFQSQIWDASGSGGTPGSALSSVHTSSGALGLSWNYEDYSADNIAISSGDLWILFIEYGTCKIGCDTNPPWNGRTMYYYYGGFYPDNGTYGNYMLRGLGKIATLTGVEEVVLGPAGPLALSPGRPNPFQSRTELQLSLPEAGRVTASIYNVAGRQVRQLLDGYLPARERTIIWDGRDDDGRQVPSGVYFVRLTSAEDVLSRKLVLVR